MSCPKPLVYQPSTFFQPKHHCFCYFIHEVLRTISFESKLLDEKQKICFENHYIGYETQKTIDCLFKVGTNSGCFLKELLAGPAEIPGTHFLVGLWSTTYHVFSGSQTRLHPPSLFS